MKICSECKVCKAKVQVRPASEVRGVLSIAGKCCNLHKQCGKAKVCAEKIRIEEVGRIGSKMV